MLKSDAYYAGREAGYAIADYASAHGCDVEFSYYRYSESKGSREDYRDGWDAGVAEFNRPDDEFYDHD